MRLTVEDIRKIYRYDESSPSGLVWNENRYRYTKYSQILVARESTKVGTINSTGMWITRINKINYLIHRLVWIWHYGDIPKGKVINHINCDPQDNRIINLELATPQQNSRRSKMRKGFALAAGNTSGISGVREECVWNGTRTRINCYARVNWNDENKIRRKKSWSYNTYGKEEALRLASEFIIRINLEVDALVDERVSNYDESNNCQSLAMS